MIKGRPVSPSCSLHGGCRWLSQQASVPAQVQLNCPERWMETGTLNSTLPCSWSVDLYSHRCLCLDDNLLLPTHGPPEDYLRKKKALGTFTACSSLGPERPHSETTGQGPAPVPPLAGQCTKWHAPSWGPPQLRNHEEVWGGLSAHQGQNSIPILS